MNTYTYVFAHAYLPIHTNINILTLYRFTYSYETCRHLVDLVANNTTADQTRENAVRAIGAFSKKTVGCDYGKDVIMAGGLVVLTKYLSLQPCALRLHSLVALSVILEGLVDTELLPPCLKTSEIENLLRNIADKFEVERSYALAILCVLKPKS